MKGMKKLQIAIDEDEEESKQQISPMKTNKKMSMPKPPSPKVIVKQEGDQEIFCTEQPDIDFDNINDNNVEQIIEEL
jgi:hypothetical protein